MENLKFKGDRTVCEKPVPSRPLAANYRNLPEVRKVPLHMCIYVYLHMGTDIKYRVKKLRSRLYSINSSRAWKAGDME